VSIDNDFILTRHHVLEDQSARAITSNAFINLASCNVVDRDIDTREQEVTYDFHNKSGFIILGNLKCFSVDFDKELSLVGIRRHSRLSMNPSNSCRLVNCG